MFETYFRRDEVPYIYLIFKVENLIEPRNARITQLIENPLTSVKSREITMTFSGTGRASWKAKDDSPW
jgi:hypothetical protein